VEVTLNGGEHDAEKTVGEALHAVGEADKHDKADDVVERLKPCRVTSAAAVSHISMFITRIRLGRRP